MEARRDINDGRAQDSFRIGISTSMNSKFNIHHHRSFWWRVCCGVAIALSVVTFTPFVIGGHASRILSLPYSLAVGLIIALAFIAVTIAGSFLYPKSLGRGDNK
jgi:hypothetical protein